MRARSCCTVLARPVGGARFGVIGGRTPVAFARIVHFPVSVVRFFSITRRIAWVCCPTGTFSMMKRTAWTEISPFNTWWSISSGAKSQTQRAVPMLEAAIPTSREACSIDSRASPGRAPLRCRQVKLRAAAYTASWLCV